MAPGGAKEASPHGGEEGAGFKPLNNMYNLIINLHLLKARLPPLCSGVLSKEPCKGLHVLVGSVSSSEEGPACSTSPGAAGRIAGDPLQGAGHTPGRLSRKINKYKATDAECQDSECWGTVSPLSCLGGALPPHPPPGCFVPPLPQ